VSGEPVGVEALQRGRHHVGDFTCGNPALDRWLHASAGQAQRADVARTYVAVSDGRAVVGYYTLVAGHVEYDDAPRAVTKGVSQHFPIPVGLIARLAVATTLQGRGLGSDLLRDGLRRLVAASEQVGMRAALVHAIDEHAAAFYRRHGFESATTDGMTLMVPLAAVRHAFTAGT
jgi:predicted N-acetyltransferase YhbS